MGCSNTKHITSISEKEKEKKPQLGSLSAKGLVSFGDKQIQQEKIDVGQCGNDNEATQIAIWLTPSTEINLNIEKTIEQTATITYSKSLIYKPLQFFRQYSNTPTISSEIVYEISPEFEENKFKTYVSEYGLIAFGSDIANNIEYFSKQLKILEILGQGAFGKVLKAYYPPKGLYLALKYFQDKDKAYEEIQSLKFMLQLQSNTIMKFYMAFENESDKQVVIVLEYGKATLSNLINVHSSYSEGEIFSFIRQVVKSFILLKEQLKMSHRDIKPENFILSQNNKEFIICDFGEACILNDNLTDDLFLDYPRYITSFFLQYFLDGTVPYMAPEVYDTYQHCCDDNCGYQLKFNPYKADIYSLGVTILIMFGMPRELRNDLRNKQKQDQILQDCGKRSELLSKFVAKMIEINPEDRFDYNQLNIILQSNEIIISCVEINENKFMEKVNLTLVSQQYLKDNRSS